MTRRAEAKKGGVWANLWAAIFSKPKGICNWFFLCVHSTYRWTYSMNMSKIWGGHLTPSGSFGMEWPYRQLQYTCFVRYIQTAWPFQLKYWIYIFGVMILQMEKKIQFRKIGPCIFNLRNKRSLCTCTHVCIVKWISSINNNNNVIYIAPFTMCSRRLEESREKRWDLSLFLNLSIWSTIRTLLGSPFQRWGPATEKARSPACFLARGTSNVISVFQLYGHVSYGGTYLCYKQLCSWSLLLFTWN